MVKVKFYAVVNSLGEAYWDAKTGQVDIYTHKDIATAEARRMRDRGNIDAKVTSVLISRSDTTKGMI